jgi:predicted GNAT family acetyltransferase
VHVVRFDDPEEFAARAMPVLLADEARHNLMLGLCTTLTRHPDVYPEFHLWTVEDAGEPVAVAMRTPPHNLLVGQPRDHRALSTLAEALHGQGVALPGLTAARPEVEEFAEEWRRLSGATPRLRMALGVYRLTSVLPVSGVPGRMRRAERPDRDLLIEWVTAFQDEAVPGHMRTDVQKWADLRLGEGEGGMFLWEDAGPVAMAGYGASTPNGVRVGPVFTPRDLRRHGYASALVAGMSSWLLGQGRRFCFLYTDMANSTSNKIYRDIGYEFVCDSSDYVFEPETGADTAG